MKVFLVQHGLATSKEQDPLRPLTKEGMQNTKRMAAWLAKRDIEIVKIHHSGKKRAVQTAEIFASHLAVANNGVKEIAGLQPNDDVRAYAEQLGNREGGVMVVGHLPFLSRLAALLVSGDPDKTVVSFVNSGVVCLEQGAENFTVTWCVIPENINNS